MQTRAQFLLVLGAAFLLWLLLWRDSTKTVPAPSPAPDGKVAFQQRLVAVGDLHGDIVNTKQVLRMAGVIDASSAWIGGTDILVQTGDIVDRGTYAMDIYHLMQRLRAEASSAGGQVVSLLGNHEVMNAIGDWRYVTQADIKYCGGTAQRQADMSTEGWLGQEWLGNYSVAARVTLGPFAGAPSLAFSHGSLRPSLSSLLPFPDKINALGASLLTRALTPPLAPPYPPNPYQGLPKGTTRQEAELYAEGGPLWWRGLASEDDATVCKWAKELQASLGVTRIIGGHTPDFDKIVHRCNASIIIIDTGISSAYGGVLSALEIVYSLTEFDKARHGDLFVSESGGGQQPFEGWVEAADSETDATGSHTDAASTSADAARTDTDSDTTPAASTDPGQSDLGTSGLSGTFLEREEVYAVYKHGKQLIGLSQRTITLWA